jgi:hypothetical protein
MRMNFQYNRASLSFSSVCGIFQRRVQGQSGAAFPGLRHVYVIGDLLVAVLLHPLDRLVGRKRNDEVPEKRDAIS